MTIAKLGMVQTPRVIDQGNDRVGVLADRDLR